MNQPPKFNLSSIQKDLLWLLGILTIVMLIWGGGWYLIDNYLVPADVTHGANTAAIDINAVRGQFGDKFGSINALFAGFAFAGIIFTILLQSREIKQTKQMLEEQLKDSNKQRFDSTFFQLLSLHNDITSKLSDVEKLGREAFGSFHSRILLSDTDFRCFPALQKLDRDEIRRLKDTKVLPTSVKEKLLSHDISNIEACLEEGTASIESYLDDKIEFHESKIQQAYKKAAALHIDNYSHYFRNLYHLLRFVHESPLIEESEKFRYAKFLRSQLSEPELFSLFYNCITKIELPGRENMELGFPKMGKLLVQFDMLQNLPPRSLIHHSHLKILENNYKEVN